jgi:3-deoxy-D-manno-octulosonate 8-phosphate phosphatase (KDO 8-P phosphatase)
MEKVGFSVTPNDGIEKIKKIADYICKKNGGEGAFREMADLILQYKI